MAFTIPGHRFTGTITLSLPSNWTITGSSGGTRNGNRWTIVLSQLSVTVAGPSGSHETMTATISPAVGATSVQTYQLN